MDTNAKLGVKFRGRENFNLKKFIKLEKGEISKTEVRDLVDLEDGEFADLEDRVSLYGGLTFSSCLLVLGFCLCPSEGFFLLPVVLLVSGQIFARAWVLFCSCCWCPFSAYGIFWRACHSFGFLLVSFGGLCLKMF